ncbi:hypothetical protein TNCV_5060311 [Trichonephila clavipes]|nr:hypothetical protein TNCV_5060311 [Trichonephila clavipes]
MHMEPSFWPEKARVRLGWNETCLRTFPNCNALCTSFVNVFRVELTIDDRIDDNHHSDILGQVIDDNACIDLIMADKDILEFIQSSKNIVDVDSDDENEMNNSADVPMSSEMRNIVKSIRYCFDRHSNG